MTLFALFYILICRMKIICKIDGTDHMSYRHLSHYLKSKHNLSSKEYYDKYIGGGKCKECNNNTKFKNLRIGYRNFCSIICLNRYKSKDKIVLEKISNSQKGIPRQKHSTDTKIKCREIMKKEWEENRIKRLHCLRTPEVRKKISKTISEIGFRKVIEIIETIRCESSSEVLYVKECINKNIKIERFSYNGRKSIETSNGWRVPDFIEQDKIVVEVKDFHPWFKCELENGLKKYVEIENWCLNRGLSFLFWTKSNGYQNISDILKLWQVIKQNQNN